MDIYDKTRTGIPSPPARGRGLKQEGLDNNVDVVGSPPARGRGLKPHSAVIGCQAVLGRPPRGGVD